MKLTLTRTGGFAGQSEVYSLDTERIDAARSAKVKELLGNANFFQLAGEVVGDEIGADMFEYELRVDDGSRSHTVKFSGGGEKTAQLAELSDLIIRQA